MPRRKGRPQQQESSASSSSDTSSGHADEATERPNPTQRDTKNAAQEKACRHEPGNSRSKGSADSDERKAKFKPPPREMKTAAKGSAARHEQSTSPPSVTLSDSIEHFIYVSPKSSQAWVHHFVGLGMISC
jgi:hypothetical protein